MPAGESSGSRFPCPTGSEHVKEPSAGCAAALRRVSVAGIPGAGKTTFARALTARLGLPHVELDALHHGPGWQEATPDELRARVEAAFAAAPEGWIADGNYESKVGDLIVSRADTFVWLDMPLPLALGRVARRTASRLVRRTELWSGNRETLRNSVFCRDNLSTLTG